jgi:hypothetical protein
MIFEIHYNQKDKQRREYDGAKCIVGRSGKAGIQIDHESLSRNHFEIEWDGKNFYLTDLNSTNGVYVNGERIVTAERVLYKNFFPIEIGSEISIYVSMQEDPEEVKVEQKKHSTSSLQSGNEPTRKLPAQNEARTNRAKNSPPKEKHASNKTPFLILLVFLGGSYYYYENFNKIDQAAPVTGAADAVKPNAAAALKVQTLDFKSWMTKNDCSQFGSLCESTGLNRPNELISLQDDKFIVYVNFDEFIKKLDSVSLNKQPPADQAEYALAYYASHPSIIEEFRKSTLPYLIVVGVSELERIKYATVVDVPNLPAFTSESHKAYFSTIFNGAIYRPFRISLRPHLIFTTIL